MNTLTTLERIDAAEKCGYFTGNDLEFARNDGLLKEIVKKKNYSDDYLHGLSFWFIWSIESNRIADVRNVLKKGTDYWTDLLKKRPDFN